jgi:hypothetical protein
VFDLLHRNRERDLLIERELAKNLNESDRERRRRKNWILSQQTKYSRSIDQRKKKSMNSMHGTGLTNLNFKNQPPF